MSGLGESQSVVMNKNEKEDDTGLEFVRVSYDTLDHPTHWIKSKTSDYPRFKRRF